MVKRANITVNKWVAVFLSLYKIVFYLIVFYRYINLSAKEIKNTPKSSFAQNSWTFLEQFCRMVIFVETDKSYWRKKLRCQCVERPIKMSIKTFKETLEKLNSHSLNHHVNMFPQKNNWFLKKLKEFIMVLNDQSIWK